MDVDYKNMDSMEENYICQERYRYNEEDSSDTVRSLNQEVTIKPHWLQCISLLAPVFLVLIMTLICVIITKVPFLLWMARLMCLGVSLYLAYKMSELLSIKYIITKEQILYVHGAFNCTTDYVELYRVFDYQQRMSFLQRLMGLKTVIIMASDRNTPMLNIIGVKRNYDVVKIIRQRVEYNKRVKQIYEIGNHY